MYGLNIIYINDYNNKGEIIMSSFSMKCVALLLMTIDHIGKFIPNIPIYFRWIGRLAAPIFIFMCVYSMSYTHDRKKYIVRLYLANIAMVLIEWMLFSYFSSIWYKMPLENNFFRTLFLLSILLNINYTKDKRKSILLILAWQISGLIICVCVSIFFPVSDFFVCNVLPALLGNIFNTEGGLAIIILGLGMNKYKNNKLHFSLFYIVYSLFYLFNDLFNIIPRIAMYIPFNIFDRIDLTFIIMNYCIEFSTFWKSVSFEELFTNYYQWMMCAALPLLLSYNKKQGRNCKYIFYLYYPIHLLILWMLSLIIK